MNRIHSPPCGSLLVRKLAARIASISLPGRDWVLPIPNSVTKVSSSISSGRMMPAAAISSFFSAIAFCVTGSATGFMIADVIPADQQPELLDKLAQGQFTMRILYEQFANIQKMGPMSAVMSMIPGFGNDVMPKDQEKQSQAKIKRMMCMMDSMTDEELDTTSLKLLQDPKRMERIGRGAGRSPMDVV